MGSGDPNHDWEYKKDEECAYSSFQECKKCKTKRKHAGGAPWSFIWYDGKGSWDRKEIPCKPIPVIKNNITKTNSQFKIYAITCSQHSDKLSSALFFQNLADAQNKLKEMINDYKSKLGVKVIKETSDKFEFLLGSWEQVHVTWKIMEFEVK